MKTVLWQVIQTLHAIPDSIFNLVLLISTEIRRGRGHKGANFRHNLATEHLIRIPSLLFSYFYLEDLERSMTCLR